MIKRKGHNSHLINNIFEREDQQKSNILGNKKVPNQMNMQLITIFDRNYLKQVVRVQIPLYYYSNFK